MRLQIESMLQRDPMQDVCDCTFPFQCSESERILGVAVDDTNRKHLITLVNHPPHLP
jgi:hypothetical protein